MSTIIPDPHMFNRTCPWCGALTDVYDVTAHYKARWGKTWVYRTRACCSCADKTAIYYHPKTVGRPMFMLEKHLIKSVYEDPSIGKNRSLQLVKTIKIREEKEVWLTS